MPTTRAPAILAIWPATEPVAPAAAETTTVSPGAAGGRCRSSRSTRWRPSARRSTSPPVGRPRPMPVYRRTEHVVPHDGVLLEPGQRRHDVADGVSVTTGFDHLADPGGPDDLAQLDRRQIAGLVVEPRPGAAASMPTYVIRKSASPSAGPGAGVATSSVSSGSTRPGAGDATRSGGSSGRTRARTYRRNCVPRAKLRVKTRVECNSSANSGSANYRAQNYRAAKYFLPLEAEPPESRLDDRGERLGRQPHQAPAASMATTQVNLVPAPSGSAR